MNAVVHAINSAGQGFVESALPMLIQSAVLILILLFVNLALRRKVRAVFRYWIWMLVLVKLVLPPSLCSPISFGTWFGQTLETPTAVLHEAPAPQEPEPAHVRQPPTLLGNDVLSYPPIAKSFTLDAATRIDPADHERAEQPAAPLPETPPVSAATETDIAPTPTLSWQALVLLTWLAVALALLLLLLQRAYFVRGLVAQAQEASPKLLTALDACRANMGLARPVALRVSPNANSPAVCGLLRPVILIPKNLAPKLQPHDLQAVLLHELAHVKRGDLWVNLVQTLLQIVYFYNPLFWLANLMIRRVREQAVDEAVLVAMGETARDYPEMLVNVAKLAFRKRPALSLRLIGVVESKSALSGRIKHILGRPLPKTAKLGLLGLVVVVIIAALLLPMARAMQPEPTVVNNGPLDIRLVGVCPDGGDQLYDTTGRKLETTPEPHRFSPSLWSDESQCREFIFEVPDIDSQLLFLPFSPICPAGTDRRMGGTFRHHFDPSADPHALIESFTFDRTYRKPWAGLIPRQVPIRAVDLTLRYFYGSRREAICTFTGPFTDDTVVQADEGRPYQLTPKSTDSWSECEIRFRFTTSQPFDTSVPVVIHDKQGQRHLVHNKGGSGGSQGARMTYDAKVVPWGEIAAITIGETPHEITFRNVVVGYPRRPRRTYPAYWDRMAQRLNLTGLSAEELAQYQFKNAREVLAVLDLLRGSNQIRFALQAIDVSRPRVDLAALDAATRDKIREVAASWLRSSDVQVRAYGVELGLKAGWAEFVDPALALLENPRPTDLYHTGTIYQTVLDGLVQYKGITAADIERLKQFARRCDSGRVWDRLCRSYLRVSRHPAAMDALWELAQDDRPTLWWPALSALLDQRDERVQASGLPEKMRLRVILMSRVEQPDDAELAPKAAALLPDIFTIETLRMCPGSRYEMHRAVTSYLDRKTATAIYMDILTAALSSSVQLRFEREYGSSSYLFDAASSLLRDINQWYEVDFGQLGVFQPGVLNRNIRTARPFEQAITEALSWYRTGRHLQPAPRVLSGRVTDTNARGIPDAKVTLKGPKVIFDERGRRSQQVVKVATLQTDADGRFASQDVKNIWAHHLDIEAEGFAKRQRLHVTQLLDGRFQIEGNAENNTIAMEKSARLSGRLIGRDDAPLTHARLFWSSYPDHGVSGHGTCRVDDQGHFTIDSVASGHHLLEYNARQRPSPTGEYDGVTGFQLVQVQEGQVIDDLVIDLRESTATLEVEITDRAGRPITVDGLSLDVPVPTGGARAKQAMFLAEVGPQNVHRFPNLPPMQGVLSVYMQSQPFKEVAVQLRADETTRCRITLDGGAGRGAHIAPPQPHAANTTEAGESASWPLTGRTEKVMPVAEQEARRLNHAYVGTEHILLALARQENAVSARVLSRLGVDIDTLRAEVNKLVRHGAEPVTQRTLPRTPRAKRVMQYAREEARSLNHDYLGTEHLLLGLMREKEGIAAQALSNLGVTWQQIRAGVLSLVQPGEARAVEQMADALDADGDGLSDFQEAHKYLTDPARRDSDGDGTPDGDWAERREYAYSVRTVFRFLPPLDEKALNDDFQDARVLEQTDDYVEIEAIHYPLATVYKSIGENRNWQQDYAHLTEYLAPGATTNWDEPMRRALLAELKADGIDIDTLSDKQVVEQVSRWLLKRSRYLDKVFTTFYVHCPNGKPAVLPGLEDAFRGEFERDQDNYDWTLDEHFDHEVLGKGMFYNKTHGSCTSTAVYLTTVLRALGIPTRMVLVSPAVDASDREQILMAKKGITHHRVRETMLAGLRKSSHGFTNHTLNEVFIGNRWVRLDSSALGPAIFGVRHFGLQTHLYTINDLGDIDLASTWGVRYAKGLRTESFRHSNPYSAVEIDDLFGDHSSIANPPFAAQDLGANPKPDIFIFYPGRVNVWDEVLEVVKDVTFNKTGRPHQREFYENLFEGVWQRKPGDILVLLFALDTEDRIPEGYEDLLLRSWPQIESSLKQDTAVELPIQARDMKVILLAAPRADQLKSLIRNSRALRALSGSGEVKEEEVTAEHGVSSPAPYSIVKFANGVEVRLLGVCTHPSAGQPWWGPDGTPLETAPYETTGSQMEQEQGRIYYEFAAETSGSDDLSIRWKVPGSTHSSGTRRAIVSDGRRLAHTYAYTANQPLDTKAANVFLGIATGDWETRAVHKTLDREGSYTLKNDHAVAFGAAYEKNGDAHVPVTTNIQSTVLNRHLVAIDIEGNSHRGGSYSSGGNVLHSSTYAFDVPLSRIKEFRFETRPYTWIEFHNVSLRPGQKTGLQVEFAAAYNPNGGGSALAKPGDAERRAGNSSAVVAELPNGVTVEFLAYSQLTAEGLRWWTPQGEPTTVPGLYEADVEGHGTLLALRMTPEPEAGVSAWRVQPPNIREELKPVWQANNSNVWLLPLGEGRSYANVEIAAQVRDPVVVKTIAMDQLATPGSGEIGARGLGIRYLAQADPGATAFAVHSPRSYPGLPTWPEVLAAIDTAGQIHSLRPAPPDPLEMQQMMVPDPFGGPRRLQVDVPTDRLAGIVIEGYSERAGRATFRNLSLRPGQPTEVHVEVEAEQRGPWWHRSEYDAELDHLGRVLSEQAETSDGRYPADLPALRDYFTDTQWKWLQEHVAYIGAGKSAADGGAVPLAFERTLLPAGFGTYVLFADGTVLFQTPDELKRLGIIYADRVVVPSRATREPPAQTKPDEVTPPSVKAELPNGVTVELVGLFRGPDREHMEWWYPDGTPATAELFAAYRDNVAVFPPFADPGFGYIVRFDHRAGLAVRTGTNVGTRMFGGYRQDDTLCFGYVFCGQATDREDMPEVGAIKVAAALGPYQTVAAEYAPLKENDIALSADGHRLLAALPRSWRSGRDLTSVLVMSTADDLDLRLRYERNNGVVAAATYNSPPASFGQGPSRSVLPHEFHIPTLPDYLKRICVDYRQASVVQFNNVSLRPGRKSTVRVDVRQNTSKPKPADIGPAPLGRHALSFDGVDDCLIVPPGLSLQSPFSIEVWLRPDPHAETWPPMSLMQKGRKPTDPGEIQAGGFFVWGGPTADPTARGAISLCLGEADGKLFQVGIDSGPPLNESGWFHLCERYAGDKYVPVANQPLLIGDDFVPDALQLKGQCVPFKGQIAEIRIWNRSLTDEEMRYYGDIPLTGHEPGLVACWDFERQPGGQIVYDLSPNANHARLGKTTDTDPADPRWISFSDDTPLQELASRTSWQNLGAAIPPDANDTRALAPGIRLDGIGSAPDGRVFISTVRDAAETDGRQYRFVLTTKAGEMLTPIYYGSFEQTDGKLWEKYTFDTPYLHRELESFRLQWRPAAGQVAVAPTAHGEILAAATDATDSPLAHQAPPGRYALAFDGRDDYLYVPDSKSLRAATSLKVEMWFKPEFPPGPYDNRPGWALLAKGAYLGTGRVGLQGFGMALNKHDDRPDAVVFDPYRATEDGLAGGGTIRRVPDDWMHFSETFQRDSFIPAPGQPLVVGRFLIPSEEPFQGQIAEVRLWDAAKAGYTPQYENVALSGAEPGLLACWTFEEGAGPIARDLSPHTNHARLGSSIAIDDNHPTWLDLHISGEVSGQVLDPNGAPVAGAQVALITAKASVTMSDGRLEPTQFGSAEKAQVIETDGQGQFRFEGEPNDGFSLVAAHAAGFALIGSDEFHANRRVRLQPWGRIEGHLARGRSALAEKIWMGGVPNSTWFRHRRDYRYETRCDAEGRFTFERVPPGWFEVGYLTKAGDFTSSLTSRTPVVVEPGQTATMKLGGEGRPVVGRFVPPPDWEGPMYFGAGLRALDTVHPERPTPDNYDQMSRREQQQWIKQWHETPEAEEYLKTVWHDLNRRHYTFHIREDGTFRIEDVIPGEYKMSVWLEERITGQGRQEEIGAYDGTVEVPPMDEAYSDEPLDLGELTVKMRTPLHVGDVVPPFEAKTLDGNDIRLANYRGRFVLLSLWSPVFHPELERLKALHAEYEDTGRLQIIGLGGTDTLDEVRSYVAEHNIEWPQIYFGPDWDAELLRQLGGQQQIMLIDPKGKIVAIWLRGEKLTDTVRDAIAEAIWGISGQVVDPNGAPVPGAQIALGTSNKGISVAKGRLWQTGLGENASIIATTDADGRFSFAEEADEFVLIAAHEAGFTRVAGEVFVSHPSIRLEPWGRVTGTLRIGPKPTADQAVNISAHLAPQTLGRFYHSNDAITGRDGRFVFENVPPGILSVGRIERRSRSRSMAISRRVLVSPGETVNIQLGGTGRPVVGRLSIPERHSGPGQYFYMLEPVDPSPPWPANWNQMTALERSKWRHQWGQTPDGQAYREAIARDANRRSYTFAIDREGRFRIEEVVSRKYRIEVWFHEESAPGDFRQPIGPYSAAIEVPAMSQTHTSEPLDVGELVLEKPEPQVERFKVMGAAVTTDVPKPVPAPHTMSLARLLDAAQAGDVVTIPKGTYTEPIEINKPLVLHGQSRDDCILEVTANQPAILVNAADSDQVTIENMTIRWRLATDERTEYPSALAVEDSEATIRNCRFAPLGDDGRSPVAVHIVGSSESTVANCRFTGFEFVVCFGEGTKGVVQDCVLTDCGRQGVINYAGSTLTAQRNIITGSKYHALRCTGGTLHVKDNLLIGNANRGIYLGNKSGRGTIINNVIAGNGTGISGFGRAQYAIRNNVIVNNTYAGISMRDYCRLSIDNNVLAENQRGIILHKEGAENGNRIGMNAFWRNDTNVENLEEPENTVTTDPGFADPNRGDFSTSSPTQEQNAGLTDPEIVRRLWDKYEKLPKALRPETGTLAWRRTDRYVAPDPEEFFPDDAEAGKRLDTLFKAADKDQRSDEEVLSTVRAGFRRTGQYRTLILAWIGNRYIWNKNPQHPEAVEIMYHAVPMERHYAVYFGLSVLRDKTPNVLRTLADICMQGENVGRITWGIRDQRDDLVAHIKPYLTDDNPEKREIASVLVQHFAGELNFEKWKEDRRIEQAQEEFGDRLPHFREMLLAGDSGARREVMTTIQRNRLGPLLDDSFLPALKACANDPDRKVRNEVARIAGAHWVWGAKEQHPEAIALMLELTSDDNREVRYNAVYYGLSVVRDKTEPIVRRLVELALADQESNFYGRIIWGLKDPMRAAPEMFEKIVTAELEQAGTNAQRRARIGTLYKDVLGKTLPVD